MRINGELQQYLADKPRVGDLVRGSGGIRKARWALPGKGKSGGVRVMYYWQVEEDQIFMLFLFSKGERSDLTDTQLKDLAKVVKELK
jgi:hypothetical protein